MKWIPILLFAAALSAQPQYGLLLKGGHVIDPKNRIDAVRDVAIAGGRIARVAESIVARPSRSRCKPAGCVYESRSDPLTLSARRYARPMRSAGTRRTSGRVPDIRIARGGIARGSSGAGGSATGTAKRAGGRGAHSRDASTERLTDRRARRPRTRPRPACSPATLRRSTRRSPIRRSADARRAHGRASAIPADAAPGEGGRGRCRRSASAPAAAESSATPIGRGRR